MRSDWPAHDIIQSSLGKTPAEEAVRTEKLDSVHQN